MSKIDEINELFTGMDFTNIEDSKLVETYDKILPMLPALCNEVGNDWVDVRLEVNRENLTCDLYYVTPAELEAGELGGVFELTEEGKTVICESKYVPPVVEEVPEEEPVVEEAAAPEETVEETVAPGPTVE